MADTPNQDQNKSGGVPVMLVPILLPIAIVGRRAIGVLDHTGDVFYLLTDTTRWFFRGLFSRKYRLGKSAIVSQIVRVGVESIFIVSLVSGAVGLILALQL